MLLSPLGFLAFQLQPTNLSRLTLASANTSSRLASATLAAASRSLQTPKYFSFVPISGMPLTVLLSQLVLLGAQAALPLYSAPPE